MDKPGHSEQNKLTNREDYNRREEQAEGEEEYEYVEEEVSYYEEEMVEEEGEEEYEYVEEMEEVEEGEEEEGDEEQAEKKPNSSFRILPLQAVDFEDPGVRIAKTLPETVLEKSNEDDLDGLESKYTGHTKKNKENKEKSNMRSNDSPVNPTSSYRSQRSRRSSSTNQHPIFLDIQKKQAQTKARMKSDHEINLNYTVNRTDVNDSRLVSQSQRDIKNIEAETDKANNKKIESVEEGSIQRVESIGKVSIDKRHNLERKKSTIKDMVHVKEKSERPNEKSDKKNDSENQQNRPQSKYKRADSGKLSDLMLKTDTFDKVPEQIQGLSISQIHNTDQNSTNNGKNDKKARRFVMPTEKILDLQPELNEVERSRTHTRLNSEEKTSERKTNNEKRPFVYKSPQPISQANVSKPTLRIDQRKSSKKDSEWYTEMSKQKSSLPSVKPNLELAGLNSSKYISQVNLYTPSKSGTTERLTPSQEYKYMPKPFFKKSQATYMDSRAGVFPQSLNTSRTDNEFSTKTRKKLNSLNNSRELEDNGTQLLMQKSDSDVKKFLKEVQEWLEYNTNPKTLNMGQIQQANQSADSLFKQWKRVSGSQTFQHHKVNQSIELSINLPATYNKSTLSQMKIQYTAQMTKELDRLDSIKAHISQPG